MSMSNEEFKQKVKEFIKRAKEAGVSNMAINNTIKLKYNEFLDEKAKEEERYWKEKNYALEQRRLDLQENKSENLIQDTEGNYFRYNNETNQLEKVPKIDPFAELESLNQEGAGTPSDQPLPLEQRSTIKPPEVPNTAQKNLDRFNESMSKISDKGLFREVPRVGLAALKGLWELGKKGMEINRKKQELFFGKEPWFSQPEPNK